MQTPVETGFIQSVCGELMEQAASSVIEATSVNMFKMRLDDWMLDVDI